MCLEVSANVNSALPSFQTSDVKHSETELWEEILKQHGLGESKGHNPKWLRYGANYFDHDTAITYDAAEKRANKRTAANRVRAQKLLAVMESGMSMKKAAKQLGIPQQTAVYILQRYRANSTLPSFDTSIEGNMK